MSKPTKKFIVTSSQMVEEIKTWEITVPDNENAGDLAHDIAMECDAMGWKEYHRMRKQRGCVYEITKFDIKHLGIRLAPVEDIETEWSIEEIDTPDQWGNEPGSPMYGVPPEGDPFWKENDQ